MNGAGLLTLLAGPEASHPFGWLDATILGALVVTCAVIVAVDARERIIPDGCNLLVAALGLASAGPDGTAAIMAAAVQGGAAFLLFWVFRALYRRLRGHHGLGLGDVKFLGAAGTWVGLGGLAPLILVACGTALAVLAVARLRGRAVTAGSAIPFGPFLVVGLLGVLAARGLS